MGLSKFTALSPLNLPPPLIDNTEKPIVTRSVWAKNLESEFALIRSIIDEFSYVSMDTEFPGVIFSRNPLLTEPVHYYENLKENVDKLKLIQVGITLADRFGNLPDLGSKESRFIWEFNLSDFDISCDIYAFSSVKLLREQGIDFEKNRELGASIYEFTQLLMSSGLVCNENVTYITFQSSFDFAYLMKAITGKLLPDTVSEFSDLMTIIFGKKVYDLKYFMKFVGTGFQGGLRQLAESVGAERLVGKAHQAGSDSLLTWHVFKKLYADHFKNGGNVGLPEKYAGFVYGVSRPRL